MISACFMLSCNICMQDNCVLWISSMCYVIKMYIYITVSALICVAILDNHIYDS